MKNKGIARATALLLLLALLLSTIPLTGMASATAAETLAEETIPQETQLSEPGETNAMLPEEETATEPQETEAPEPRESADEPAETEANGPTEEAEVDLSWMDAGLLLLVNGTLVPYNPASGEANPDAVAGNRAIPSSIYYSDVLGAHGSDLNGTYIKSGGLYDSWVYGNNQWWPFVIVQDNRRPADAFPNEIPEFVQWLVNSVKECIEMLRAGTYNDFVRENLPPQHRTGKIRRSDFWTVWPENRAEFFEDISEEDVAEFIRLASIQTENYHGLKDRLPQMTANDFYRFCAIGYAACNYKGCDKTPKEQYYLNADGRDDGLKDLPSNDPEAFHAWLHDKERRGGHPWEVCRGGNSTHVSLMVVDDENGYWLYLAGNNRTIETIHFYLALSKAGIPVYLREAPVFVRRLQGDEMIGIVPEGVIPKYCEGHFPDEHIIDYMNLPDEDREQFLPFCIWYDEPQITLLEEGGTET